MPPVEPTNTPDPEVKLPLTVFNDLKSAVAKAKTEFMNGEAATKLVIADWETKVAAIKAKTIELYGDAQPELHELIDGLSASVTQVKNLSFTDLHAAIIDPPKRGVTPAANAADPANSLVYHLTADDIDDDGSVKTA